MRKPREFETDVRKPSGRRFVIESCIVLAPVLLIVLIFIEANKAAIEITKSGYLNSDESSSNSSPISTESNGIVRDGVKSGGQDHFEQEQSILLGTAKTRTLNTKGRETAKSNSSSRTTEVYQQLDEHPINITKEKHNEPVQGPISQDMNGSQKGESLGSGFESGETENPPVQTADSTAAYLSKNQYAPTGELEMVEIDRGNSQHLRKKDHERQRKKLEGIDYVAVGEIEFKNYPTIDKSQLRELVESAAPGKSNIRIVAIDEGPELYDYVITGSILQVSATPQKNRLRSALGSSIKLNGQKIVDPLDLRLTATIALKAESMFENTYVTVHQTVPKRTKIRGRVGEDYMNAFIGEALQKVAGDLFKKIQNQKDFKSYPRSRLNAERNSSQR